MSVTIFAGSGAAVSLKSGKEIGKGSETGGETGIRDGKSVGQQRFGVIDPQCGEPFDIGFTGELTKLLAEISRVIAGDGRQLFKGDLFAKMQFKIGHGRLHASPMLRIQCGQLAISGQETAEQILQQLTNAGTCVFAFIGKQPRSVDKAIAFLTVKVAQL